MRVMPALIIVAAMKAYSVVYREDHFSPSEWCTVRATHDSLDPLAPVEPRVKNLITGILRVLRRRQGAMSRRLDSDSIWLTVMCVGKKTTTAMEARNSQNSGVPTPLGAAAASSWNGPFS